MDFSAPTGTPVYATGDGVIKRVDQGAAGYGKHIRIDHGYGYVTLYAHLSKYKVKRRKKVKRGNFINGLKKYLISMKLQKELNSSCCYPEVSFIM